MTNFNGDLYQIGVVARDIEMTIEHYRSLLGLGPFLRIETQYEGRFRNWRGVISNKNAFAKWGELYLEIVQPNLGESTAKDWLKTRGEGVFHLGYAVDEMSQRPGGADCIFESWGATLPDGSAAVIHLDTAEKLGYYIELSDRALANKLNASIDEFCSRQTSGA